MARRRLTFWIDDELADALKRVKERDGIPEAEQLRRALKSWFKHKGLTPSNSQKEK